MPVATQQQRHALPLLLLLCGVLAVLLLLTPAVRGSSSGPTWDGRATLDASPTATRQHMKLCYLYFGAIGDLGWTFTYNAGRIKTHETMTRLFPNIAFESVFTQSVAFMSTAERHDVIAGYVRGGCHVVLSNNALLMNGEDDVFAASYPNVTFLLLDEYRMEDRTYPNRVYVANDVTAAYYAAGAAAGVQATRCIAFLAAWDNETDPTNAWAGFLLGVRRSNATIPVHVIAQNSWYYPESDKVLVDAFMRTARCDVVARYSDPSFVDAAVGDMLDATRFSIGAHNNLEVYVGDSVLTSVYSDWSVTLLNLLVPMIRNGTWDRDKVHFYGVSDGAVGVAPISPRGRRNAAAAMEAALATIRNETGDAIVCGVVPLRRGGYVLTNATPSTTCKAPHRNIRDFITGPHVVHHNTFVDPSTCPAGTRYEYTFAPNIGPICHPCASGTFSPQPGAHSCTPCPPGTVSSNGNAVCIAVASHDVLSAGSAAVVAVCCFVGAVAACGALATVRSARKRNQAAPKKAPLCLVHCTIEASGALERFCCDEMAEAKHTYVALVESVVHRNGAYLSIVTDEDSDDGQGCLVACNSAFDAVGLAVEVQEMCALTASWPPKIRSLGGLKPRVVVHHCIDVVPYLHVPSMAYRYRGPDVDAARSIAAFTPGGCIMADQRTVDALKADGDFGLVLAYEIVVRLWRTGVAAEGEGTQMRPADLLRLTEAPPTHAAIVGNLYSIHSKKLQQWYQQGDAHHRLPPTAEGSAPAYPSSGGPPPALEGMDPDLNRSVHSSFSTTSSLTLGLRQLDMGPPQVAMALYAVLQAADRYAPGKKRALLLHLATVFGLKGTQLSARRVAAGLAFRVVEPLTPHTNASGGGHFEATTGRTNTSLPETPHRASRVELGDPDGIDLAPDFQSPAAAPPLAVSVSQGNPSPAQDPLALPTNPLAMPPTALQPSYVLRPYGRGTTGQHTPDIPRGYGGRMEAPGAQELLSLPSESRAHTEGSSHSNGPIVEMLRPPQDASASTYNALQRPSTRHQ